MQKTNFKTRLLALLTAVFMVIMCVPFAAFADNTVTVGVRFIDNDTKDWINKDALVNVEASQSEAEAGKIAIPADKMPQNYVIASQVVFNNNGRWLASVYLDKKPAAPVEDRYVTVHFFKDNTNEVGSAKIKVVDGEVTIADSDLPEGWVLEGTNVITPSDGETDISVYVKAAAPVEDRYVTVHFFKDNTNEVGKAKIKVVDGEVTIADSDLPEGWVLEGTNVITPSDGETDISVYVKAAAPVEDRYVTVHFFKDNTNEVGKAKIKVVDGEVTIADSDLPEGWVLEGTNVITPSDGETDISVYVKAAAPVEDRYVTVHFFKDNTNEVGKAKIKVVDGEVTIADSDLPEGWVLEGTNVITPSEGETNISVFVTAKAVAKKTVHVHFFSDAVTEIGSVDINVNADATSITIMDNMIPEGYALDRGSNVVEITKDQTQVSLFVSPVATPTKVTITVNMFDEANGVNGKPVKTYTVSADKDAKSIKVDPAQIPTGYVKADDETFEKNVIGGKDDYVAFWIKKDAKAPEVADIHVYIKSSNNDLGTVTEKNIMLTKSELTGEYKAFALKATAKNGYHLTGWTVTADGKNVATVKADAATVDLSAYAEAKEIVVSANFEKNASTSASSTSSSSSNKTTTASNEKQVVKAAAAPANTTKVLPKTGASNVAPLLGGSLAVVALLMGYGVYSLVLRKKD